MGSAVVFFVDDNTDLNWTILGLGSQFFNDPLYSSFSFWTKNLSLPAQRLPVFNAPTTRSLGQYDLVGIHKIKKDGGNDGPDGGDGNIDLPPQPPDPKNELDPSPLGLASSMMGPLAFFIERILPIIFLLTLTSFFFPEESGLFLSTLPLARPDLPDWFHEARKEWLSVKSVPLDPSEEPDEVSPPIYSYFQENILPTLGTRLPHLPSLSPVADALNGRSGHSPFARHSHYARKKRSTSFLGTSFDFEPTRISKF